MLLGTFQGIYPLAPSEVANLKQKIEAKTDWEHTWEEKQFLWLADQQRPHTDKLGYSPVWFFPMSTLGDTFAHVALSIIRYPTYFYIYDLPETELTKIDARRYANERFKYVARLKRFGIHSINYLATFGAVGHDPRPPRSPLRFTTNSDDSALIHYIINEKKLDNYKPLFCFPVDQNAIDNERQTLIGDYAPYKNQESTSAYNHCNQDVFDYFENMINSIPGPEYLDEIVMRASPDYRIFEYDGPNKISYCYLPLMFHHDREVECNKEAFTFADLPYLYEASIAKLHGSSFRFNSETKPLVKHDFEKYENLKSQFLEETSNGRMSEETYKTIFNNLKAFACV